MSAVSMSLRASSGFRTSNRRFWKFTSPCYHSNNKTGEPFNCWSCASPFDCSAFFCASCGTLQPIVQKDGTFNYFAIFGLKPSFQVDPQQLSKQFKDLQRMLHPDKFGRRSDEEKKFSQQCSTAVNEAYVTLLDPIRRALHLLQLNNVKVDEKSLSSQPLDQNFLLTIMELNEEVESVNSAESHSRLDSKISEDIKKLVEEMGRHFAKPDYESAKSALVRARYFTNVKEKMKELKIKFVTVNRSDG